VRPAAQSRASARCFLDVSSLNFGGAKSAAVFSSLSPDGRRACQVNELRGSVSRIEAATGKRRKDAEQHPVWLRRDIRIEDRSRPRTNRSASERLPNCSAEDALRPVGRRDDPGAVCQLPCEGIPKNSRIIRTTSDSLLI
jgi:hypothetical protein